MSNISFNGSIPECLKNFIVSLEELINLGSNNFSGVVPNIFFNATKLKSLDVSNNQLEGNIPRSLSNCKAMELMNVQSNKLKDKFPSWLGSLPLLGVLLLRANQLYGPVYDQNVSIGFQSLRIIDISHKGVHTEFERIRKDFRAIDFSGNKFSGEIPESIRLLKELRLLNLSSNEFTSKRPESLANLKNLETLDLSLNKLSGQIPQGLGSLTFLSTMNFSHNNLEDPIPQSTQFQSQNCSSFMQNPKLQGLDEEICGKHHVPNLTPQQPEELSEEQTVSWISAAIAYMPGVLCGFVIAHIYLSHRQ